MVETSRQPAAFDADVTTVAAPAKINLTLAVQHRRPDGYHEIESLMVAVTLCDELTIASRREPGIVLECDLGNLPCDSRNLIHRAATRLAQAAGLEPALHIRVQKRIPVGAGLGGGSSDAAATLLDLNRRWRLKGSIDDLSDIAAELGSDVPFFLQPSAAIVRSRGERIDPVSFDWPGWFVLMLPDLALSTADVYRRWQPGDPQPIAADVLAAQSGGAAAMAAHLGNMLERPAFALSPALADLHRRAQRCCEMPIRMSGSGSTLFALCDDFDEAQRLANRVQQQLGIQTQPVQCLSSRPERSAGGVHEDHRSTREVGGQ